MNADPADTRSPHLDLEDLIAGAAGQATDGRTREHLARCEHCRAEANRWNLIADGVRGLLADTPQAAPPALPRRTRPRVLAGPGRRTVMAVSAAAALVVLGGAGYWAADALGGHSSGPVLTAVSGCPAIEQARGTLTQVNGGSLVIKTASGQPVNVTTTASTRLSMSGALLSDITDGASVVVAGPSSGGTIEAVLVSVKPPFGVQTPPGFARVQGTVSDASTAGFTVVTSTGARVPVTTSSDTVVNVFPAVGQLPAGATTVAFGHAGPDGTLQAIAIAAAQPLPGGRHLNVQVTGTARDCSPASLTTLAAALVSGG